MGALGFYDSIGSIGFLSAFFCFFTGNSFVHGVFWTKRESEKSRHGEQISAAREKFSADHAQHSVNDFSTLKNVF